MNAPAFVLASAGPARAVLTARPWLCGTRVASAARLPLQCRSTLRIFACASPPAADGADAPADEPLADEPVAVAAPQQPEEEAAHEPVAEAADEPVAEAVDEPVADAPVADEPVAEAADEPVAEAIDEPVAETAAEEPVVEVSEEPVADAADEPVTEAGDEPVAEGVTEKDSVVEAAKAAAEETQKRKRRRGQKREVTMTLEELEIGQELEGVVKSVTDYGAFIGDMGTPTDGLLHVSQLTSGFVEKVTDVVNIGDKIKVRILGIDLTKGNFSLTMKTPEEVEAKRGGSGDGRRSRRDDQSKKWADFSFDPMVFVDAKVTSVTDFGAFCKLIDETGEVLESAPTEGLIHISELSESHVDNVSDVVSMGDVVKVRVMSIDRKRNRISMSLKEFSESSGEGGRRDIAAEIASAKTNQPTFKTAFELAFERAQAPAEQ